MLPMPEIEALSHRFIHTHVNHIRNKLQIIVTDCWLQSECSTFKSLLLVVGITAETSLLVFEFLIPN